jgi:hypothetical protein
MAWMRPALKFYLRWMSVAFKHPWGIADFISSVLGLVVPIAVRLVPAWHTAVTDLQWQIPLAVLGTLGAARLLLAPYWIYREQVTEIERLLAHEESLSKRKQIGWKLAEYHLKGRELYQRLRDSTDDTNGEYWAEQVRVFRQELANFVAAEISTAKAVYVDAVPNAFMAVDMVGLKSLVTAEAKIGLLQRLDHSGSCQRH